MTRLISDRPAWRASLALIAVGSAVSLAHADIIVTEGVQPWHLCATCHSLDGISAMARFPKLAGQRAAYIVKQVRDFRDGRRSNDGGQMQASASDIDDNDLAKTAAYFAGLPPPPPDDLLADRAEARRGATLYQDGDAAAGIPRCRSCHDDAKPGHPQGPFLMAQHAGYLAKQLHDWRAGARMNDAREEMPAIAAKLSDQDIAAVAAFLASQQRSRTDGKAEP
jgi:cytochrome c553